MSNIPQLDLSSHQRQIHLDFHTSPFIGDVGKDFYPEAFAGRLLEARVNSINIFAKCHHGMCYYPTKTGVQHPALNGRDMFGEMLEALKSKGIRTTAYTTVVWEEEVANRFPQWRQMKADDTFAHLETSADGITKQPAGWKFNNFIHPDYLDYFEAHLKEIFAYDVEGLWIDILFYHPKAGWSAQAREIRKKYGWMEDTPENLLRLEAVAQERFAQRFTPLILGNIPQASIFYNAPNPLFVQGSEGIAKKSAYQTHYEIESLPSGMWGYYHFPRTARHLRHKGMDWNGMTGKFQKMWGDFGGIKPQAALEYECFRTQAMGGANCVGDQLHPRGVLDEATYQLIGSVYESVEAAEDFYLGSTALPQIGVLCPNHPTLDLEGTGKSEEGVCLMLEELHYDYDLVDDSDDFSKYELLILPDSVVADAALVQKLDAYEGKLLASFRSGFDASGRWLLPSLPVVPEGLVELYPTYWSVREGNGWQAIGERVVYSQGMNFRAQAGTEVLVDRVLPYFKRTDLTYSSHFQTPPDKVDENSPAVMGGGNWVIFADPIFREYRRSGNIFVRDILGKALLRLIGPSVFGQGLPASVEVYPRKKGDDLLLTLIHYIPCRKALDIDVIEQGQSFAGEILQLEGVERLFCQEMDGYLEKDGEGSFILPSRKGRLLLKAEGYFG